MRGLFLDNLTVLVGDVFKGVANSTSRMKESVLFHKGEEEKKYKQVPRSLVLLWLNLRTRKGVLNENEPRKVTNIVAFAKIFSD